MGSFIFFFLPSCRSAALTSPTKVLSLTLTPWYVVANLLNIQTVPGCCQDSEQPNINFPESRPQWKDRKRDPMGLICQFDLTPCPLCIKYSHRTTSICICQPCEIERFGSPVPNRDTDMQHINHSN